VDHPLQLERVEVAVRPWRLAALALTAVAAVELMLLVVVGGALLAKPESGARTAAKRPAATRAASAGAATPARPVAAPVTAAELPRRKVGVLVLNGNGRQGAAGAAAARVSGRGYRVRGVANAPSHDYARSIVMYRPGFEGEGRRLAADLGIRVVGPLDGMRPRELHGAHTVLILGS
jgi:hypothetical protein